MNTRTAGANTYTLRHDYENHLATVSGWATNTYTNDGSGPCVKVTIGSIITE